MKNLNLEKADLDLILDQNTIKDIFSLIPFPFDSRTFSIDKTYKKTERESLFKFLKNVKEVFIKTPTLLYLHSPIKIFGSLNGQFNDLIDLLNAYGGPQDYKSNLDNYEFLFLGNIINRGIFSLEVVCLLFALKVNFKRKNKII